jgi:hypothetical protein
LLKTRHPKIFIGKIATYSTIEVESMVESLVSAVRSGDEGQVRRVFNNSLPEAGIETKEISVVVDEHLKDEKYFTQTSKLGLAEK